MPREPPQTSPLAPRALVERACARMKVFPLQGVAIFPGAPTPFHIFEPRYRELTADALAGDRVLAVPQISDAVDAPFEMEPVRAVAGAGVIEEWEKLPDGRYQILVRGVARVRLVEELPSRKGYREFRAVVLEDALRDDAASRADVQAKAEGLEQLLLQIAAGLPDESGAPRLAAECARLGPSALADIVAAALVTDGAAKQAILEELDVSRRLDLVLAEAGAVVLAIGGANAPRS
jgi:Lon protease-like protein